MVLTPADRNGTFLLLPRRDSQLIGLSPASLTPRDSQGTRLPSPAISYLTFIPFMCTARSVSRSCAWSFGLLFVRFLARGCFVLLAWFCSRSLAGPGLAVRFLWFSAGSATGFSVAGFPLRASLLVVLFGHWSSPRPLAISSRGWAWCRSRFFSFVGSAWSWFAFSARACFGLGAWLSPLVLFARCR